MSKTKPSYTSRQRDLWSKTPKDYRSGSLRDRTAKVLTLGKDGATTMARLETFEFSDTWQKASDKIEQQKKPRKKQKPKTDAQVFYKVTSHRSWKKLHEALGQKPQTYYKLNKKKSAATYVFKMSPSDVDRLKDRVKISKLRDQSGWQPTINFV